MTMCMEPFEIGGIPAILYGEPSKKAYLFIHGKGGRKEEAEAFAGNACPAGYQVIGIDLPEHGERRDIKDAFNPWTVVPELRTVMDSMQTRWRGVSLRANSIGAYFSMLAFNGDELCKALLVSPILDMEKLICDMMARAGVMENELQEKGEITTKFGETLSWRYLTWVRKHPVNNWSCPTAVLYAGQDNMTSRETVDAFVAEKHAALTVMENGEHWFHTPQQMEVLTAWEQENM